MTTPQHRNVSGDRKESCCEVVDVCTAFKLTDFLLHPSTVIMTLHTQELKTPVSHGTRF